MNKINRRDFTVATAGTICSIVSGCTAVEPSESGGISSWEPRPGNWPLSKYNLKNTNSNPTASPPIDAPNINKVINTSVRGITDVLIADNILVAYGHGIELININNMETITSRDGTILAAGFGPPTTNQRRVYWVKSGREDRNITVICASVGGESINQEFRATIENSGHFVNSLQITENYVLVGDSANNLTSVDRNSGKIVDRESGSSVTIGEERVFSTYGGSVVCYRSDEISGGSFTESKNAWRATESLGRLRVPALADDSLLVGGYSDGSTPGHLHAFSVENGDPRWNARTYGWWTTTPAVGDGVVYSTGTEGTVVAISLDNGSVEWTTEIDFRPGEAFLIGNDTLLVRHSPDYGSTAPNRAYLAAYDAATGEQLWDFNPDTTGEIYSIASVADRLYVPTGNKIYVLNSESN